MFLVQSSLLPYFKTYAIIYFIHSAALPEVLWQTTFLQDRLRSYIDKWHPSCFNWRVSTSPKDAFQVKQNFAVPEYNFLSLPIKPHILTSIYLQRCLRDGLVHTVVTEIQGRFYLAGHWWHK